MEFVNIRYQETGRALHKDVHWNPEEHHQIDRMPQAVLLQKVQSSRRETIDCFQVNINLFYKAMKLWPKNQSRKTSRSKQFTVSFQASSDETWVERETLIYPLSSLVAKYFTF